MKLNNTIFLKYGSLYFHLCLSVGFALLLLVFRMKLTHSYFYLFLVWNLFLAGIPFIITQIMKYYSLWRTSLWQKMLLFLTWLLFLPNSPYIITDLVHLHNDHSNLLWLDLFLVFVFALNGLLLGLASLIDMYGFIAEKYSQKVSLFATFSICLLSGYGIYLGRFLRFNSWDILTKPVDLFEQIVNSLFQPKVWAITLAFGGLLWVLFSVLRSALVVREQHLVKEDT